MDKKKKIALVLSGCVAALFVAISVAVVGVNHVEKRLRRKLAGL